MLVSVTMGIEINKALTTSCQASRARYQAYLDDKKHVCESNSADTLKRKAVKEMDSLKAKKQYHEADIVEMPCIDLPKERAKN